MRGKGRASSQCRAHSYLGRGGKSSLGARDANAAKRARERRKCSSDLAMRRAVPSSRCCARSMRRLVCFACSTALFNASSAAGCGLRIGIIRLRGSENKHISAIARLQSARAAASERPVTLQEFLQVTAQSVGKVVWRPRTGMDADKSPQSGLRCVLPGGKTGNWGQVPGFAHRTMHRSRCGARLIGLD
jgi:hypothetical protein